MEADLQMRQAAKKLLEQEDVVWCSEEAEKEAEEAAANLRQIESENKADKREAARIREMELRVER